MITGRWRGCDDDDGGTRCAGDRWVSSRVCRCRASTSPDRCHGAIGKVKRTRRRLARVTIQRIRAQFQRGLFRAQCGLTRRRPNILSEKWRPFSAHTMALRSWPRPVARSPYGRSFKVLQVPPNVRRPGLQNCPTRAVRGVGGNGKTFCPTAACGPPEVGQRSLSIIPRAILVERPLATWPSILRQCSGPGQMRRVGRSWPLGDWHGPVGP